MLFHVRCAFSFCEWIHSTTHLVFSLNGPDGSQDGSLFFDLDHTKRFAALYRIAWIPRGSRGLSMVGGLFRFRRWMGFPESKSTRFKHVLKGPTGATYKNPSVLGVCDWILQNQSTKIKPKRWTVDAGTWHWEFQGLGCHVESFLYEDSSRGATCDFDVVWSWLQACDPMMEEIQILWLFQCPEKLWVESFETDTVFKTKHLAKWEDLWTAEVTPQRHIRV